MPTLRIDLDLATYDTLAELAAEAWRPPLMQAQLLLRRAIGQERVSIDREGIPQREERHEEKN